MFVVALFELWVWLSYLLRYVIIPPNSIIIIIIVVRLALGEAEAGGLAHAPRHAHDLPARWPLRAGGGGGSSGAARRGLHMIERSMGGGLAACVHLFVCVPVRVGRKGVEQGEKTIGIDSCTESLDGVEKKNEH